MRQRNEQNTNRLINAAKQIHASVGEIPPAHHKLTLRAYQALKAIHKNGAIYDYPDFPNPWPINPQGLVGYLVDELVNYGYIYQGQITALGRHLIETVEGK
jgi:hypothetical protein